jgi:hypothetical protein
VKEHVGFDVSPLRRLAEVGAGNEGMCVIDDDTPGVK